jgi:hypothetical protein
MFFSFWAHSRPFAVPAPDREPGYPLQFHGLPLREIPWNSASIPCAAVKLHPCSFTVWGFAGQNPKTLLQPPSLAAPPTAGGGGKPVSNSKFKKNNRST